MTRTVPFRLAILLWCIALTTYFSLRPRATVQDLSAGHWAVEIRPDLLRTTTLILRSSDTLQEYSGPAGLHRRIRATSTSLEIPRGFGKTSIVVRCTGTVQARLADPSIGWSHAFPLALASTFLIYLLSQRRFPLPMARLMALGTGLRLFYSMATPWSTRAWDSGGHAEYIRRLVTEGSLPCAGSCWECYHPPFYYLTASLFWKAAALMTLPGENGAIILSLICSILVLAVGLNALRQHIPSGQLLPLGLILAVWPPFLMQAGKINNDVFLTLFSVFALHQAWSWVDHKSPRTLVFCGLWCGLALLSKANGSLTTLLCGWIICSSVGPRPSIESLKERLPFAATLPFAALAAWLASSRSSAAQASELLVGNIGQQAAASAKFPYGISQLIHIDFAAWFSSPQLSSADYSSFWNTLGKDALFGQFKLPTEPFSSFGFPALITFSALLLLFLPVLRRWSLKDLPWLVATFLCLGALFAFRCRYPYPSSLNLRYAPLVLFFALEGLASSKSGPLHSLARWYALAVTLAFLTPLLAT